jgi:hypothetical protein
MKKTNFNRLVLFGCCVVFLTLTLAANVAAQSSNSGNVKTQIAKVNVFGSTAVVPQAGASLSRNNDAVLGEISTSGLTQGHVVTLWWAIFNNPQHCAAPPTCAPSDLNNPAVNGSLQFGGGVIVGAGGRADFKGYLAEGDNTGFYLNPAFPNMPNPAPGIVDTKKAQIHLSIRTHGAANSDPTILQQQLTSFPGGCAVSTPSPCATIQAAPFLQPSASVAQSADFDGDGRSDVSIFRPSDGTWHIMESDTNNYRVQSFGLSGDKIVPGDYDGDERTDFAVYRPSTGVWYVLRSSDSSVSTIQWGLAKDKPAPADYDGDGRTDIAVYRDGAWYIVQSSDGSFSYQQFGLSSDIPIAASAQ